MHSEENTPNEQPQGHTEQTTPGGAETHEAGVSSPTPGGVSATTQALIDLLRARDATGLKKYGTTLDRTDLTQAEWLQHLAEELLDGAGYALAAMRTAPPRPEESDRTPDGYAHRYPDGAIRFSGGCEVNGMTPAESIPVYFHAPQQPSAPVGVEALNRLADVVHEGAVADALLHERNGWDVDHRQNILAGLALASNRDQLPLAQQPAAVDEALQQAARSLRTIADQAGKAECMEDMQDVRGYANSRATVAEAALAGRQQGGQA